MSYLHNASRPILIGAFLLNFLYLAHPTQAAIVDSDQDGLSDSAETQVYHTNPNQADTDRDGVPDGQEIVENTNPLDQQDSTFRLMEEQERATQKQLLWIDGLALLLCLITAIRIIPILLNTTRSQPTPPVSPNAN